MKGGRHKRRARAWRRGGGDRIDTEVLVMASAASYCAYIYIYTYIYMYVSTPSVEVTATMTHITHAVRRIPLSTRTRLRRGFGVVRSRAAYSTVVKGSG